VTDCTASPDTTDCFNQLGFVFEARPGGSDGHSNYSDLSYQIWAYGTTITDAGEARLIAMGNSYESYTVLVNV